jgi:hypothetical protein
LGGGTTGLGGETTGGTTGFSGGTTELAMMPLPQAVSEASIAVAALKAKLRRRN